MLPCGYDNHTTLLVNISKFSLFNKWLEFSLQMVSIARFRLNQMFFRCNIRDSQKLPFRGRQIFTFSQIQSMRQIQLWLCWCSIFQNPQRNLQKSSTDLAMKVTSDTLQMSPMFLRFRRKSLSKENRQWSLPMLAILLISSK